MIILAIESSCDETAAAVVENGRTVRSSVVASQIEEHRRFGGVVPEIASRMHTEAIVPVTAQALEQAGITLKEVDAVAVTYAPGLIGALLVGVNFAKGLCIAENKPLVPVHHIKGHIAANYIAHPELKPPFLCLVASGGHSHIIMVEDYTRFRVIGRTRDDAAGEAFDKAARAMGFPYPGGVFIDKAAAQGNPKAYPLPRPKVADSEFDLSFSGLKTAVINQLHNAQQKGEEINTNDMAASFQSAVVETLTSRLMTAAAQNQSTAVVVAGGVAANSGLRTALTEACDKHRLTLYMPPLSLCGDNAAMIGAQGYYEYLAGNTADLTLNARASMAVDE
ncbi:tRNA (adenosine(37)-N6)-threonylcarbamoyltransferase complex transferase subunit TsaD [Acetanaerobacterium elongatum]|uniref:tRNA N6-adenosine threonylcarbamoyltransferase n=1 Tax=Acetanaerobacterium elongatum TaxID=258515 RepID=A0A1G9V6U8_9FIRM|nr:tRNA (adenosine(37)-N6)-threonylcarbamoyltransferase complex transferase subunit TsaD [Acetanaerobacterium elongatum]SDM67777.1 O-sialoglycoprotein endopeptidase [Acetanaerobacterium elongatum]